MLVVLGISIMSMRRGGLRRQLRFMARRFRLALALGGAYLIGSAALRIAFTEGAVADFGPPVLALALLAIFVVLSQDPDAAEPGPGPP
jgi:hypothetical protein